MAHPLTAGIAKRALKRAEPVIRAMLTDPSKALSVVIGYSNSPSGPRVVLHENYGAERETWEHPYDGIAFGKFDLTAKHGIPSREVQCLRLDLLDADDVLYWGSAIEGTVVVACSGFESEEDEAVAKVILAFCMMLIYQDVMRRRAEAEAEGKYQLPPAEAPENGTRTGRPRRV